MMRRLQKMIGILLVVLVMASSATPAFAKSVTAKVSSSSAKVYKRATKSSASVKLKKGTKLKVTAVSGGWAKVKLNGKTGYMPKKYLTTASSSSSSKSRSSGSGAKATGYIRKSTYVYRSASSSSSRRSISKNTKVTVVGRTGSYYKVKSSGGATGYVKASCVSASKSGRTSASKAKGRSARSWKSRVVRMDWFNGGEHVLEKGSYGSIYDIDTGISLRIKRMGGHYHADVEPATAADTAKLLSVAGGHFSWDSHAVVLKAGGKYVACGINTKPHGDQTIHNNHYEGQFCLHMSGSKTHASSKENDHHQSSIDRAYRWAHR